MRYVPYIRVSTAKQGRSGLGLEAQLVAITDFMKAHPTDTLDNTVYREVESGRHNDRPELKKAINVCKAKRATLLIAKLDRLARNAAFLLNLQDSGLDFVCCDTPMANKLTIGILAVVAQDEAERISARTKAALAAAKARGVKLGCPKGMNRFGARIGFGHIEGIVRSADDFAETLRPAVESMKDQSLRKIAASLNANGYTTRTGKTWQANSVRNLLKRLEGKA